MKFNEKLAEVLSKKNCKKCWGRGYLVVQHSAGSPITKTKEKDGIITSVGSPIFNNVNYCFCVDKKMNKIKKEEQNKEKNKVKKSEENV